MTPLHQKLMAIIEEAEKATRGPWEAQIPAMTGEWPAAKIKPLKITGRLYGVAMLPTPDANFIASSRINVPRLAKALVLATERMERMVNFTTQEGARNYLRNTLAEIEKEFE